MNFASGSGGKLTNKNLDALKNALAKFDSRIITIGSNKLLIDKKHILERHHPKYWNGSVKSKQSFLDEKMTVDDVADAVEQVIYQNRDVILQRGTIGMYQISGTVNGIKYVVGFNNGRVGQFYPVYPE